MERLENIWSFLWKNMAWSVGIAIVAFGVVFVLILLVRRSRLRKRAREKYSRELEYTLPDRENSFIRERLLTAIRIPDREETESVSECRFSHAKALLERISATSRATLSETNELREIAFLIEGCEQKERLTVSEIREINDAFGRLLKTSAKYL